MNEPRDGDGKPATTNNAHGQGGDDPIPLKAILMIAAAAAAGAYGGARAGSSDSGADNAQDSATPVVIQSTIDA